MIHLQLEIGRHLGNVAGIERVPELFGSLEVGYLDTVQPFSSQLFINIKISNIKSCDRCARAKAKRQITG